MNPAPGSSALFLLLEVGVLEFGVWEFRGTGGPRKRGRNVVKAC